MNKNHKETVKVLWTGGFDSTFRILQLSFCDLNIQPIYFYHKIRTSRDYEINTVRKLTEMIRNRETTKANLLDVLILGVDSLMPIDEDILEAYKRISKHESFGPQNKWIAMATRKIPGLQISFEKSKAVDRNNNIVDNIDKAITKKHFNENGNNYLTLEKENGEDYYTMLKDYQFPLEIASLTKEEMLEKYKEWDAYDIAENTWVCHYPVRGEACGYCIPCRQGVEELGIFRLKSKASRRRFKFWKFHLCIYKIKKTWKKILKAIGVKPKIKEDPYAKNILNGTDLEEIKAESLIKSSEEKLKEILEGDK